MKKKSREDYIKIIKKQCEKSIINFENKVGDLEYIPNGILLWEGFAFCTMIDLFNIDVIIESGIAGGRSTEIFGRYCDQQIYAMDNVQVYKEKRFNETAQRLAKYENITCIKGDAFFKIIELIKKNKASKIALFIDGPKGIRAITLAKKCCKYPNVKFVGIHDQCKTNYHQMDTWDLTTFYTDSKWLIDKYSYLDRNSNNLIFKDVLESCPNGPGVGFAINDRRLYSDTIYHRMYQNLFDNFLFFLMKISCIILKIKHNI